MAAEVCSDPVKCVTPLATWWKGGLAARCRENRACARLPWSESFSVTAQGGGRVRGERMCHRRGRECTRWANPCTDWYEGKQMRCTVPCRLLWHHTQLHGMPRALHPRVPLTRTGRAPASPSYLRYRRSEATVRPRRAWRLSLMTACALLLPPTVVAGVLEGFAGWEGDSRQNGYGFGGVGTQLAAGGHPAVPIGASPS